MKKTRKEEQQTLDTLLGDQGLEVKLREKSVRENMNTTAAIRDLDKVHKLTRLQPMTINDVVALRGAFRDILARVLPDAVKVLQGDRKWSSQQVQLFRTLANKVVPDVSQSHITYENASKSLGKFTRQELEDLLHEEETSKPPIDLTSSGNDADSPSKGE